MPADPRPQDRLFEFDTPAGWIVEHDDEDDGVLVTAPDGVGLLHIVSFPQPVDGYDDPADELYAFLEEQGVEIDEEDVDDLILAGGAEMALCEYLTEADEEEDDDAETATYWLVAVATAPGILVFCSYSCPADHADVERETVLALLTSIRLDGSDL